MKIKQLTHLTGSLVVVAAMAIGTAGSASAAFIEYGNDAEFLASGFNKVGGVNLRWGDSPANGDWEFSVVNGNDLPQDQKQVNWGDAAFPSLSAMFSDNSIAAELELNQNIDISSIWAPGALGSFNTILFRAKADDGQSAILTNIVVNGDSSTLSGGLSGDADAQYVGISMNDFFSDATSLSFDFTGGGPGSDGSVPGIQVKFGYLPPASVPEPGTLGLLALGAFGLVGASRKRS